MQKTKLYAARVLLEFNKCGLKQVEACRFFLCISLAVGNRVSVHLNRQKRYKI